MKQKDENVVVEIPQPVMIPLRILGFLGGLVVAIIPISIGIFLWVAIPFIGFILAIPLFVIGFMLPFTAMTGSNKIRRTQYIEGGCPRCNTNYKKIKGRDKAFTCSVCKRRILITETGFELA